MKLTLVTLYDNGFASIGDQCARSMRAHAGAMSADVFVYTSLIDPALHPSWNKLLAIRAQLALMQPGDWATWIDADCVVVRPFPLRDDLEDKHYYDLLVSQDHNGLCMGVFAAKACPWTLKFIDTLLFCMDVRSDDAYGAGCGPKWEQNAVKALLAEFPATNRHVSFLDKAWVEYPWLDLERLHPIHHLGGLAVEERLRILRTYPYGVA